MKRLRVLLLIFFFLSGACGLVYEVVWLRIMGLVFGNTTFATSTVLAGYMAGLGLGALYFGKVIDRRNDPVRLYGLLEGGVGLYALLTPLIWKFIDLIHIWYYRAFDPSFIHFSLFRFGISFLALLFPTFLMGGTLPVISKYFVRQKEETARKVGLLYALNTLGAVMGVLFSSFISLYYLGAWQTVLLTAVLNFVIAYVCVFKLNEKSGVIEEKGSSGEEKFQAETPAPKWKDRLVPRLLLVLFGVSGAVSMMYEIGWTRVLAIVLGSSVYAFSVMLATFLLGISLGSWLFSLYAKYRKANLMAFTVLQFLTAISALIGLNRFESMPYDFIAIFRWSHGSLAAVEIGKFALAALVMLPPTLSIGATFACFIHVYQHSKTLGRGIGNAYFANTAGTILGSALTGFFVVPVIGIRHTLMLAAGMNAAIGIAVFLCGTKNFVPRRLVLGGTLLAAVIGAGFGVRPWNTAVILSGTAVNPKRVLDLDRREFTRTMKSRQFLFYKEGVSATVSVNRGWDNLVISMNGKPEASTEDVFTMFLTGHLPMLLHPKAEKVLVIGMGSGMTLTAIASYPVSEIHCVEIEEAMVEGARYFDKSNRYVLYDPRVKIFINDGRNFLLVRPEKYDVIISEPSNPWMAGVANLFSKEHYRTMGNRLNPGGIVCQWVQAYSMSTDDLKMIVRTFSQSFKQMTLWTAYYPDLMLIGTNDPGPIDFRHIQESFKIPEVKKDFMPHGIRSPEGLFSCFFLGDKELRRLSAGARINSDNHPYLEFSAPKNLYRDTLDSNFKFLNSFYTGVFPEIANLDVPLESNPQFYREAARGYVYKSMYKQAKQALNKSRQIGPETGAYYEVLGLLNRKLGQTEDAALDFAKAIQLNPEFAESRFNLGAIFREKGMLEQAVFEMTEATALSPGNPVYLRGLADALYDAKQYNLAMPLYDKVSTLKGGDFHSLTMMMDIIFQAGDLQQQISMANLVIERYPEFVQAYGRLGLAYETRKMYTEALRVYESWAKQWPDDAASYISMARVYDQMGEMQLFRRALRTALRLEPELAKNPVMAKALAG